MTTISASYPKATTVTTECINTVFGTLVIEGTMYMDCTFHMEPV